MKPAERKKKPLSAEHEISVHREIQSLIDAMGTQGETLAGIATPPTRLLDPNQIFDRFLAEERAAAPRNPKTNKKARKANDYFKRAVLAAEIIRFNQNNWRFGRIKLQKLLYLCEFTLQIEAVQGTYQRDAAGPHDNALMRSVTSIMEKQHWYRTIPAYRTGGREEYVPLERAGTQSAYFDRYWGTTRQDFDNLMKLFYGIDTEGCQIIVTLYACWNDLLLEKKVVTDDSILSAALQWHEAKKEIPQGTWQHYFNWMKSSKFIPSGTGKHSQAKKSPKGKR